ncbi:phosphotriesterase [Herbiconiux sp. A18JL235]|uniref:Phosphotriesterase n=1 Tax=Herbiconiux sp. A18JL235 TaxID=3152363 RepID=A0AB39BFU1_9MICO
MIGRIRTVTGDIDPAELGPADYHEHLFQVSPLLPGDDLDDEEASGAEAASLLRSGFTAMVDATPLGLGRRPEALARISRATGLRVVMTTGVHRREHYATDSPLLGADAGTLAAAFVRDLEHGAREGLDPEPDRSAPCAGLLKAGLGYWRIDAAAARCIEAVGVAHAATGAPVMVHLEHGSAAHEALDLLGSHGVAADAVALAHVDRNPDAGLLGELAARGAYLGVDGPARHREWPDSVIVGLIDDLVRAGHGDRVLLGGDVARASRYRAYGGLPGLAYLGERFLPRVVAAVGAEAAAGITTANPARWLSWR